MLTTQSIKYAGSKRQILPTIVEIAKKLRVNNVVDAFSGSTRVSQAFAASGFATWSNDRSDWSRILSLCYLKNKKSPEYYRPMLHELNNLPGVEGWFTEHYGGEAQTEFSDASDGRKKIWQRHNTMKLDAIRPAIDRLTQDEVERAVLLTSLMLAMDKVDSTVGHHVSYLRSWSPRSYNTMVMHMPQMIPNLNPELNSVTQLDVFDLLNLPPAELYYFDPPYGSSNEKMPPSRVRYASYYHLWTTLIRNDQPPLVGAAGRRADVADKYSASIFEEFRKSDNGRFIALEAIERMLQRTRGEYCVLSYNNQGRATYDQLLEICSAHSTQLEIIERPHKSNVMRSMVWTKDWAQPENVATCEYLFVMKR